MPIMYGFTGDKAPTVEYYGFLLYPRGATRAATVAPCPRGNTICLTTVTHQLLKI